MRHFLMVIFFLQQSILAIPNTLSEYQFSITLIVLYLYFLDFSFVVTCPQPGLIWTIRYEWIAINDQRISVINSFNMNPPSDEVFNHQLLNANAAIIGYSEQLDFQLSITQLSVDNVSVGITKITGEFENLTLIGYQILLIAFREIIDLGFFTFIPVYNRNTISLQSVNCLQCQFKELKYNYQSQLTLNLQKTFGISSITQQFQRCKMYVNKGAPIKINHITQSKISGIRMPNLKKLVRNQIFHQVIDLNFMLKFCQFLSFKQYIFQFINTLNKLNIQENCKVFIQSLLTHKQY
ncbi:unnamed protein product [Paramecium primaurelia]|uniref:Transmembrane protein n=1 Tax=Paramecium primaurelia TaxID=5886 RepID=A0A8S1K918_PARPR|nr:unnamed protein product [Paramecium primaurelia]CAD8051249.1 unnamed protein product [Paramecium primaurelia]